MLEIFFFKNHHIWKVQNKRLKKVPSQTKNASTFHGIIEKVLLICCQEWTQMEVADVFDTKYPEKNPIDHSTDKKLVKKTEREGICCGQTLMLCLSAS